MVILFHTYTRRSDYSLSGSCLHVASSGSAMVAIVALRSGYSN